MNTRVNWSSELWTWDHIGEVIPLKDDRVVRNAFIFVANAEIRKDAPTVGIIFSGTLFSDSDFRTATSFADLWRLRKMASTINARFVVQLWKSLFASSKVMAFQAIVIASSMTFVMPKNQASHGICVGRRRCFWNWDVGERQFPSICTETINVGFRRQD
jgi:hypothetical protein